MHNTGAFTGAKWNVRWLQAAEKVSADTSSPSDGFFPDEDLQG